MLPALNASLTTGIKRIKHYGDYWNKYVSGLGALGDCILGMGWGNTTFHASPLRARVQQAPRKWEERVASSLLRK